MAEQAVLFRGAYRRGGRPRGYVKMLAEYMEAHPGKEVGVHRLCQATKIPHPVVVRSMRYLLTERPEFGLVRVRENVWRLPIAEEPEPAPAEVPAAVVEESGWYRHPQSGDLFEVVESDEEYPKVKRDTGENGWCLIREDEVQGLLTAQDILSRLGVWVAAFAMGRSEQV
jgi:hypothetical protein